MSIIELPLLLMDKLDKTKLHKFIRVNDNSSTAKHFDKLGVNHDTNDYLSFTKKSIIQKRNITEQLKKDYQFGQSTFVYAASGYEDLERLSFLNFSNIICIDYQIENYECIQLAPNKKLIKIPTDLITSIAIMKVIGVKVGVWCDNNSGQNLGFGTYSTVAQNILSSATDLFGDEVIIIGSYSYQKKVGNYQVAKNYLKIGYETIVDLTNKPDELEKYNLNFDFNILTLYPHSSGAVDVNLLVRKKVPTEKVFNINGLNIHLVHGNIFDFEKEVDMMLMVFRSIYQYTHFKNNYSKVWDGRGKYKFENEVLDFTNPTDILDFVKQLGHSKIGITPQNDKNKNWLDFCMQLCKTSTLTDLYFFHLDKNDYEQLYTYYEEQIN